MATPKPPLRVPCEGSGCTTLKTKTMSPREMGMCQLCGELVPTRPDATQGYDVAVQHDRNDVLAMLERGDFG